MRGFFDPGELPGDQSMYWPEDTDVATYEDPYKALLQILTRCRHVGASGWFQFGKSNASMAIWFM